jgi:hypothetical protein
MKELFVSPILLDYKYLENLCAEAKEILKINLPTQTAEQEFKLSIFLNFNRYLTIQTELMPENIKNGFYEDLMELMEGHKEKETVALLIDLDILPEAREEFLEILKNLK